MRVRYGKLGYWLNWFGHTKYPQHRFYRAGKLWLDIKWGLLAKETNSRETASKKRHEKK